jgi:hypothetical protein
VFDNPSVQGSCLWNQNVDNCVFLDYLDTPSDGVLPLATPNRAPVIQAFNVVPTDLGLSETATATATIQDPEGDDYTLAWTAKCYDSTPTDESISPATDSHPPNGPDFTAIFTAPSAIADPIVWCEVKLKATDENGNTSSATRNLIVSRPGEGCVLEGTIYGPNGQPLTNTTLTLQGFSDCEQQQPYSVQVTTDANGHYRIEDVPCCQICNGYVGNFSGNLLFDFLQSSTSWKANQSVYLRCPFIVPTAQAASGIPIDNCQNDIYLPTVWGALQGTYFSSGLPIGQTFPLFQFDSYVNPSYTLITWVQGTSNDGATAPYGPIAAPVGEGSGYSIPQWGNTVTQDVGGTGTVSGTAYHDDGTPAANVQIFIYFSSTGAAVTTTTDGSGNYSFTGAPTGSIEVYGNYTYSGGSAGGYLTQNGGTLVVDLNSPDRCDLEGILYNHTGQPLPAMAVSWQPVGQVITDNNGLYDFMAVQPRFGALYSSPCFDDGSGGQYCLYGYRYLAIGTCPGGGNPVRYDLPSHRYSRCQGGEQ